jgi:hypothetical protein
MIERLLPDAGSGNEKSALLRAHFVLVALEQLDSGRKLYPDKSG